MLTVSCAPSQNDKRWSMEFEMSFAAGGCAGQEQQHDGGPEGAQPGAAVG